jgi:hypothetical protein
MEPWPDMFADYRGAVFACVSVGPSPDNTELFSVKRKESDPPHVGAFRNSMLEALVTAFASRREVTVEHDEDDSDILSLSVGPAS